MTMTSEDLTYEEKLTPSRGAYAVIVLLSGMTFLAFAYLPRPVSAAATVIVLAGGALALHLSAPTLKVTATHLHAGKAVLPLSAITDMTSHIGQDATRARGAGAPHPAYFVIRGWISPVVVLRIDARPDPTAAWILSTRHPEALLKALQGQQVG